MADKVEELALQIQQALDMLEIRGERNASIVVFCHTKCNDILKALKEGAKTNEQNQ